MSNAEITPKLSTVELRQAANCSDEQKMIATVEEPIVLGTAPVRVTLEPAETAKTGERTLASRLLTLAPRRRIYLVLRNLSVAEQPGVLYHLYLDLPPDAKPGRDDLHHIGALNFFNASESGGFGAPVAKDSRFYSYDITNILRNLQSRGLLSDQTTLTITPSGIPAASAKPTIGRIEIVEQ